MPHPDPSAFGRGRALLVAACCLAVLVAAAFIDPDPAGHGTHTQLGLTPCMWAQQLDSPCPTCGMTTAFAHAANLDLFASLRTQPVGMLLTLVVSATFWGALHVALFGSGVGAASSLLFRPRVLWAAGGLTLLAWVYKILTWNA